MKDNRFKVSLKVKTRESNKTYNNVYMVIDGKEFEVVPHCRSKMETAFFYALLNHSELMGND